MKEFDLKLALAGEPVKLRDGSKAYVKYVMPEEYTGDYPLRGVYLTNDVDTGVDTLMWKMENNDPLAPAPRYSIIGMWEEPRPRVQLNLPCPLKEPQEGMWYLHPQYIRRSSYSLENHDDWISINRIALENGSYFATKEDAEEWQQAMCNSRK